MKLSLSLKRNKATCKGVFVVSIWFYYKYNVKLPEPGVWVCNHARLLDPGAGLAWLPDPGVGLGEPGVWVWNHARLLDPGAGLA
jgi:hypothetical protein